MRRFVPLLAVLVALLQGQASYAMSKSTTLSVRVSDLPAGFRQTGGSFETGTKIQDAAVPGALFEDYREFGSSHTQGLTDLIVWLYRFNSPARAHGQFIRDTTPDPTLKATPVRAPHWGDERNAIRFTSLNRVPRYLNYAIAFRHGSYEFVMLAQGPDGTFTAAQVTRLATLVNGRITRVLSGTK